MALLSQLQSFAWCKSEWNMPKLSEEAQDLIKQFSEVPQTELSDDIEEFIARSNAFPIPFPIDTVRLKTLKHRRPVDKLKNNIISTYPLLHERVLALMANFLVYKRQYGSDIEKAFYKYMTISDLIDRLLKKRAITFMSAADKYLLISGEKGSLFDGLSPKARKEAKTQNFVNQQGWESIGKLNQRPPLLLENCLSYDEMKLSAMLFVSSHTECINDGERRNCGVVNEEYIEKEAVIIGAIGPRFTRRFFMDYQDILITEEQNTPENGYGENMKTDKHMWRQLWADFFEAPSYTHDAVTDIANKPKKDVKTMYTDRFVRLPKTEHIFDNEVYHKRISIISETVLLEADARAREVGKLAYVNVIGCGLGVWKISAHQVDVYVLSFIARIKDLLDKDLLQNVSDVNFAYITPSNPVLAMFTNVSGKGKTGVYKVFLESNKHPKGGINVTIKIREPSSRLEGSDEGKLLVMTYPWDSNAHPGNEFWIGKLKSSGDPAAACSTQVSELHNAHINTAVTSNNTRIAANNGLQHISSYCKEQS